MAGNATRRSRGLLGPVLGGLLLIAVLIAVIALRTQLWQFLRWLAHTVSDWLTGWAPAHPRQTGAIVGFAIIALGINWIAHVRGRLRAWIFALVVEIGLWLLFWNGPGIPSLKDLLHLRIPALSAGEIVTSTVVVVVVTGIVFWLLEMREGWKKYRHSTDDD